MHGIMNLKLFTDVYWRPIRPT